MRLLLALLLAAPAARAATGVISVDPGDPAYEAAPRKGARKKGTPSAGDVQVGVDAAGMNPASAASGRRQEAAAEGPRKVAVPERKKARAALPSGSRVQGIYAVYAAGGRWMLVEREGKRLKPGSGLAVIGSRGVGEFRVDRATRTYEAGCDGAKPAPRRGWLLGGGDAKAFSRVGTPVIAILLRPGARFDARAARFATLRSESSEALYRKLEGALRKASAEDLAAGTFQMDLGDEEGHRTAAKPDPERIRLKLDFAARVGLADMKDPLLVVDGAEYSRSYRRCLRLVDGTVPAGPCVEMPHELMTETAGLEFVSYDPSRSGRPFILAFTERAPLWGHERWGFQTTPQGAKLFLRDALDPRCRDAF